MSSSCIPFPPFHLSLDLSDNKLTSSGVLALVCELNLLTNLQYLDLSYNHLRFDYNEVHQLQLVECLRRIVTLKYLTLAGNRLSRDGAIVLANHLTQLYHLDLSDIANQLSLQWNSIKKYMYVLLYMLSILIVVPLFIWWSKTYQNHTFTNQIQHFFLLFFMQDHIHAQESRWTCCLH